MDAIDDLVLDTAQLERHASTHQTRALVGELTDHVADADAPDLEQALYHAWGADTAAEMRGVLDDYRDHPVLTAAVIDGIRDDAFDAARREVELLLATDRPFSDTPFRPMLEAETTGTKELYAAVDADAVEIRPTLPDDLPYEDRFGLAMRWCTTFHHNVTVLDEASEIAVPGLSILVSTEPDGDRPWPYTVADRIHGEHLDAYFDRHGPDTDTAIRYKELNDAGRDLAMDRRVSYPPGITDKDFLITDGELYFVDTGQYLGDYTDQQFDAADHVPDDWRDRCNPDYWR